MECFGGSIILIVACAASALKIKEEHKKKAKEIEISQLGAGNIKLKDSA